MLYIIGGVAVVAIIVLVGSQMNRQAAARGPRKGTNHLAKIRSRAQGKQKRR